MVLNVTFNNISVTSWQAVLLVEETGVPRENLKGPSRIDNPETLVTLGTQDTGQINLRENLKGQSRTDIHRHWQHWAQMTQGQNNTKHRKHNTEN